MPGPGTLRGTTTRFLSIGTDSDSYLAKKGVNNNDGTITWTIDINNVYPRLDLSDATLTDTMTDNSETVHQQVESVKVQYYDENGQLQTETTLNAWQDLGDGKQGYKFPADAGRRQYKIVCVTRADTSQVEGELTVSTNNRVDLDLTTGPHFNAEDTVEWGVNNGTSVTLQGTKTMKGNVPAPQGTAFTFELYKGEKTEFTEEPFREADVTSDGRKTEYTVSFGPFPIRRQEPTTIRFAKR